MKRRRNSLIFMAVALVFLLGIYFITLDKNPEPSDEFVNENNFVHKFFDREQSDIISFSISNGSNFLFTRNDNSWVLEGHENFRLNVINVATISFAIAGLESTEIIESDDLAAFGLEDPLSTVNIMFSDNQEETLFVGKLTVDGKYHYAMTANDNNIYTISKQNADRFFYSYDDFLEKGLPQIDLTSLEEIEFELSGHRYSFSLALPYGVEYIAWNREEYVTPTNKGKILDMAYTFDALISNLNDLRLSGVIIDADQNLAEYGLDVPPIMVNIYDGENRLWFYVGNTTDNGLRYIMLEGDKYVYTARSDFFTKLDSVDTSAIFNRRLVNIVDGQVETVTIRGVGPNRNLNPNSDEEQKSMYRNIFELNWDNMLTEAYEISEKTPIWILEIQAHIPKDSVNQSQLNNNDGNYELQYDGSIKYLATFLFYEYNNMFYAVSRDGANAEIVISRDKIDSVLSAIN